MKKASVHQVYSFLDYIKGGMEINAFIGIDFTGTGKCSHIFNLKFYSSLCVLYKIFSYFFAILVF